MSKLRVTTKDPGDTSSTRVEVFLDGQKVPYVKSLKILLDAKTITRAIMEFYPEEVNVDLGVLLEMKEVDRKEETSPAHHLKLVASRKNLPSAPEQE